MPRRLQVGGIVCVGGGLGEEGRRSCVCAAVVAPSRLVREQGEEGRCVYAAVVAPSHVVVGEQGEEGGAPVASPGAALPLPLAGMPPPISPSAPYRHAPPSRLPPTPHRQAPPPRPPHCRHTP